VFSRREKKLLAHMIPSRYRRIRPRRLCKIPQSFYSFPMARVFWTQELLGSRPALAEKLRAAMNNTWSPRADAKCRKAARLNRR